MATGRVRVGCSGWQYRHWRGDLYPADLPTTRWLERYARTFDTVEINASFYRLPAPDTARSWAERVPAGFSFAWKASRFLTHRKKLNDPAGPLASMLDAARALGPKLGPVLFQLPPRWGANPARLEALLALWPRRVRVAFEFRDPSWYDRRVLRLLERHGAALCAHDMPGSETPPDLLAGPFVYVRFHGAGRDRYGGRYGARALRPWAGRLVGAARAGRDVYAYFNNDARGAAPHDALDLRAAVERGLAGGAEDARFW